MLKIEELLQSISTSCILLLLFVYTVVPTPTACLQKTTSGQCCSVPFMYKGLFYDACTEADHNRPWCSLDAVYEGRWGNCGEYSPEFPHEMRCQSILLCYNFFNKSSCDIFFGQSGLPFDVLFAIVNPSLPVAMRKSYLIRFRI